MCFYLYLYFFFLSENDPGWDTEIKDDVIEECNKHGGIIHVYVDKNSAQVSPKTAAIFPPVGPHPRYTC